MIGYTINAALKSGLFERVIVSTDCPEIAEISKRFGAEVPFMRKPNIADDNTPVSIATLDTLDKIDPNADTYEYICQLMANCPLRTSSDITASFENLLKTNSVSQISTSGYGWLKPNWAIHINEDRTFKHVYPVETNERSQDSEQLYCPNGAIWWSTTKTLRQYASFIHDKTTVHQISLLHSVDIDEIEDFEIAEKLMELSNE